MYPTRNDPKVSRLDDLGFRCLSLAFEFVNDTPWNLKRRGWLYHNEGFPVSAVDFQRCIPHHPLEEVEAALGALCSIGGQKHSLLVWDKRRKAWRVRNWRKWQDGFRRNFTAKPPQDRPDSTTIDNRRKTLDKEGGDSAACPFCGYANEHPGEPIPDGKRFRSQRFHDCAVSILGPCYPATARAQKAWKGAAEEFGEDQALELWRSFLAEPNQNGHPIDFFQANFQKYREQQARRDENIDDTRPG